MPPRPPKRQEISAPGTTRTPCRSPAEAAASQPAVVSWSVIAMTSSLAEAALASSSDGVSVPSEQLLCVCRSIRIRPGYRESDAVSPRVRSERLGDGGRPPSPGRSWASPEETRREGAQRQVRYLGEGVAQVGEHDVVVEQVAVDGRPEHQPQPHPARLA